MSQGSRSRTTESFAKKRESEGLSGAPHLTMVIFDDDVVGPSWTEPIRSLALNGRSQQILLLSKFQRSRYMFCFFEDGNCGASVHFRLEYEADLEAGYLFVGLEWS